MIYAKLQSQVVSCFANIIPFFGWKTLIVFDHQHKKKYAFYQTSFLRSGSELLGVVMSVGRSVGRSLENFDNF